MGWFLYDNGPRHEMGKHVNAPSKMFDRVLNKASEVIYVDLLSLSLTLKKFVFIDFTIFGKLLTCYSVFFLIYLGPKK